MHYAIIMHLKALTLLVPAVLAGQGASSPVTIADYQTLSAIARESYHKAEQLLAKGSLHSSTCTLENVQVRKEWGSLSEDDRKSYIDAVKCLQSKPSHTPSELAPGAKTRFDDFVAAHINQTITIHFTANFMTWHRYFTWLYEEALQVECGYNGTQPYWDWPLSAITGLEAYPLFDGSDTSMSGNGVYIANQSDIPVTGPPFDLPWNITVPAGSGGGCIHSGPFVDYTVNLGPVGLAIPGQVEPVSNPNGNFAYNPRCLKRDLTDAIVRKFNNATSVLSNVVDPMTFADFRAKLEGNPYEGDLAVHGGGHFSVGGEPGRDLFVSPGDPTFFHNHCMIDRVWWLWQMQDPEARQSGYGDGALSGTITFNDRPPSRNGSLDDINEFGFAAGPPRRIGDLLSTTSGPFCYIYA